MSLPPKSKGEQPPAKFKVLYVDDEHKALKYFSKALSPELDVITAQSAEEALEILKEQGNEIGVLATDQRMPNKCGIDLLKITHVRWPNIVAILISAYADIEDVIESINYGRIFQYVRKPWNTDKLQVKILEALQEHSRNKYNSELARINRELEQAHETQNQFINMLSHEVRTPVNISAKIAEKMLRLDLSDDQKEHVESIKVVNDNLSNLLNNSLDYSKWSAGQLKLGCVDFHLEELLRDISGMFELQASNAGLDYVVQLAPNAKSKFRGDPDKLSQVLINLISNAIKFTPNGGKIEVNVQVEAIEDSIVDLQFSIKDSGEGIDSETQHRLFEPFYQHQAGKGGTGLGLSISKELVSMMGGQISFSSEIEKGSEFRFSIQLGKASADNDQENSSARNRYARKPILLVEDSVLYQTFVHSILTDEGYAVDLAGNGQQALSMTQEKHYSLILMDCQMPIMNGFEAALQIRTSGINQVTPIVAFTAMTNSSIEQMTIDAGMNDYVSKPFNAIMFLDTVHRWVGQRNEAEEA